MKKKKEVRNFFQYDMSEFCPKASQECRMRSSPAHCAVSECTGACPSRSALSWGAGTYPAAAGRHGHHWGPLVGPGVVPLGTAELGGVVSAPHSIDHVLVHSAAQVLPPRPHRGDGVPPVLLRVVAFHCGEREAESASAGILSRPSLRHDHRHLARTQIFNKQRDFCF